MATQVGGIYYDLDLRKGTFDAKISAATNQFKSLGKAAQSSAASVKKTASGIGSSIKSASSPLKSFSTNLKSGVGQVAGFATAIEGKFNSALSRAAPQITKAAKALTGFGVAFLGISFGSALGLEKARTQFEILLGSTELAREELERITEFAASTPFSFDAIAGAEKTLLGFGRTLKETQQDVSVIGDVAGATGADFEALSVVYGQVNAAGRLMGQDSLQLINNNVPITTLLAKKLGISVSEVKEEMENGAITADIFNEALLDSTSAGGLFEGGMEKLSKTVGGRISTLKDNFLSLGRSVLGVTQAGDIVEGGVFDRIGKAVEALTVQLQDVDFNALAVSASEFVGKVITVITTLVDFVQGNSSWLIPLIKGVAIFGGGLIALVKVTRTVKAAFDAVRATMEILRLKTIATKIAVNAIRIAKLAWAGAQKLLNLALAANPLVLLAVAIGLVVAGLILAYKRSETFRNIVNSAFNAIKDVAVSAFNIIKNNLGTFATILGTIFFGPISLVVALFVNNWEKIKNASITVFNFIKGFLQGIWSSITTTVTVIVTGFVALIKLIFTGLRIYFTTVFKVIRFIFVNVFKAIRIVVTTAVNVVRSVITSTFNTVRNFITRVLNTYRRLFSTSFNFIKGVVLTVFNFIKDFLIRTWNTISRNIRGTVTTVKNVVTSAFNFIKNSVTSAATVAKDLVVGAFNRIKDGVTSAISSVIDVVSGVGGRILSALGNLGSLLVDEGSAIINGLLDGIKSSVQGVYDFVGGIGDTIKSLKGPIKKDRVLLTDEGNALMFGLNEGIKDGLTDVLRTTKSIAQEIKDTIEGDVNGSVNGTIRGRVDGSSSTTENLRNNVRNGVSRTSSAPVILVAGTIPGQNFNEDSLREFGERLLSSLGNQYPEVRELLG